MSDKPLYDLNGRTAIVTGAAGGFGAVIVERLRRCGATPVLWDLEDALRATQEDPATLRRAVDVTVEKTVRDAAEAAFRETGRIDILVNNAGILGPIKPTWEYEAAEFRRVLDVNLIGAFHAIRACVPMMRETARMHPGGRIVNIASIQAKEGMALAAAYSVSKAGLIALTKSLAKELAADGILVNAVTPSASMTAMGSDATPERLADILSRIPMARFLEPDELAAMVVWLCSSECSFSTGAVFDLSGGRATY